jgi:hypothetical protein
MRWNRTVVLVALPTAAVAVFAGIVSYTHVYALAMRTEQGSTAAHLLPLSLDGLIVAGSAILLAGSWLGWLGVVPGVAGTLYANVVSMLPHGHLAATVASWPAIAFSVATFMLERWLKSQVGRGGQGGRKVAADVAIEASPEPLPEPGPEPVPATVATCGHQLAGEPSEVVVQAYLHGRDCLGETPSQRHLAATYGLHRTKVAALVGPLNGHGQPEGKHARA